MTTKTVILAEPVYDDNGYCDDMGVNPIYIFRYDDADQDKFVRFMAGYTGWFNDKVRAYRDMHGKNVYCPLYHIEVVKTLIMEYYSSVTQDELFNLDIIEIDEVEYV